jgi:6-pyruvoyltetrahydropterin/6-carboxytetrahydropterin synthase
MVTVTRTYEFSASHRLHAEGLSDSRNLDLFGKCNWVNGHGHNYEVEVSLSGDPDPVSGRLADLDAVDKVVDETILTPFDHRHLNMDVPEFRGVNPTSENLTLVIWNRLAASWDAAGLSGARLHRVAVRETPRNYFEYYGPNAPN